MGFNKEKNKEKECVKLNKKHLFLVRLHHFLAFFKLIMSAKSMLHKISNINYSLSALYRQHQPPITLIPAIQTLFSLFVSSGQKKQRQGKGDIQFLTKETHQPVDFLTSPLLLSMSCTESEDWTFQQSWHTEKPCWSSSQQQQRQTSCPLLPSPCLLSPQALWPWST